VIAIIDKRDLEDRLPRTSQGTNRVLLSDSDIRVSSAIDVKKGFSCCYLGLPSRRVRSVNGAGFFATRAQDRLNLGLRPLLVSCAATHGRQADCFRKLAVNGRNNRIADAVKVGRYRHAQSPKAASGRRNGDRMTVAVSSF
jgi:hypothetical protein